MTQQPDFGDVTGEYLALRSGAGLVAGTHDVTSVHGGDAVRFLDGLLSRAVDRMEPGEAARSLLLSPQGKLRATLWLLMAGEDEVIVLADAGRGAVVAEDLGRFRIRVDAEIASGEQPGLSLWGPAAHSVMEAAGLPTPDPGRWTRAGEVIVANLPFMRSALSRLVVIGADPGRLAEAGAVLVGSVAATAVRIEAGEPVMGVDLDEKTIPQEGGVVAGAVDFDKGCYLGQELVARIDSRGHVNRMLRGLVFSTNVLAPLGAEITHGDVVVGNLTSVGESLELRAPVALGMVRREVTPSTTVSVRWDGGAAEAQLRELPLDPGLGRPA